MPHYSVAFLITGGVAVGLAANLTGTAGFDLGRPTILLGTINSGETGHITNGRALTFCTKYFWDGVELQMEPLHIVMLLDPLVLV